MVKSISFFVAIFTICIFAQNPTEPAPVAQPEPAATEAAPVGDDVAAQPEQVAEEAAPVAPAAPVVAPAPAQAQAPAPAPSAKEAIIESPIEFAIVSAVFIATVLLITLTGN